MHYVHNGLVFLWRAAVVKGELVQALRYRGFRSPIRSVILDQSVSSTATV
jgi:hypothetical protein